MSSAYIFPYGITLRDGGAINIFPAAELTFSSAGGERISLFLVIDSGATISALPKSDATMFGIDAERGAPMTISGIGWSPLKGWKHEIVVGLSRDSVRIPIVFLDSDQAPRILGRAGFFDRYTVVFEERKRRSGIMGSQTNAARRITKILDGTVS